MARYDRLKMATQKRRVAVSLDERHEARLEAERREHGLLPSTVMQAALDLLENGGPAAEALREAIQRTDARVVEPRTEHVRTPAVRQPGGSAVQLVDLVAAGRLARGDSLRARFHGIELKAVVEGDGQVRFEEQLYPSPSSAGDAAKTSVVGPSYNGRTAGWDFWRASDRKQDGLPVPLKVIRGRFLASA